MSTLFESPPHDLIAEYGALWQMQWPDSILHKMLTKEHFYERQNQQIFEAIKRSNAKHGEFSIYGVEEELKGEQGLCNYIWLTAVVHEAGYAGTEQQVYKRLSLMLARRKALKFHADQGGDLPSQFIDEGRELQTLLTELEEDEDALIARLKGGVKTVPTGYGDMDKMLKGGIEHGAVYVIAARPGVGKTALAVNIAARNVHAGRSVCFLTLEMAPERIYERMLQCMWKESQTKVLEHVQDMKIGKNFKCVGPSSQLSSILTAMHSNVQSDLIIIDYYQLITEPSGDSQAQKLEIVSNEIKRFALEMEKPVILLAQLNREIEGDKRNREPQLSDLRGCGALEQDAHSVSFLWDENAKTSSAGGWSAKADDAKHWWILRKNRNGPVGKVMMKFSPDIMQFETMLPDFETDGIF